MSCRRTSAVASAVRARSASSSRTATTSAAARAWVRRYDVYVARKARAALRAAAILASHGKALLDSNGFGPRFAEPWKDEESA